MRRFMVVPIAALLVLAVAAPVAAKPSVQNTSGGGDNVYGEWFGPSGYGYVSISEEDGFGGQGEVFEEVGTYVLCEGTMPGKGVVAEDTGEPGEEFYGFVGMRTWGYVSVATIDISRRLETGVATGTVELQTGAVDECAGTFDEPALAQAEIEVSLVGAGSLASFRGSSGYHLPSEFNGHDSYRGKERQATGTVRVGNVIDGQLENAFISQWTWTSHSNG